MSKIIYVCNRSRSFDIKTTEKLTEICNALVPDNVTRHDDHRICVENHVAYAVSMHNSTLHEANMSVLLGFLFEEHRVKWWELGKEYPDGNYALFRINNEEVEVVSDGAGTRTIWYYHDDEVFVASTSQRAIVMYLESFSFDERVIPWLLSTGSLGPQLSWDKRLKRTQVSTSLLLNKVTWSLTTKQRSSVFLEEKRDPGEHKELLTKTIANSINTLNTNLNGSLDYKRWILPLSGGYDSRAILCFMKESMGGPVDLKTVTWGLEESINEDGNDAKIAKDLAHSLGVHHEYYHTNISSEPIQKIVDRFILCSEGRIDHIAAYMDGMDIWKRLFESNITGIIRGDEGFGWAPVSSELTVRLSIGCALCSDFEELLQIMNQFGFPSQELPPDLLRQEGETLETWRDRLYHSYRLPSILAGLSDIKFSYVEQINPLLSAAILKAVRSIPDNLRTDKCLFKSIVNSIGPSIPFAHKGANASPEDILRNKSFADLLYSEINSDYAINLFGEKFAKQICAGIKRDEPKSSNRKLSIKKLIASMLPRSVKNVLRDTVAKQPIDGNVLAFRVFMIAKMHKVLSVDAEGKTNDPVHARALCDGSATSLSVSSHGQHNT